MPKPLIGHLEDYSKKIEHLRFADHHNYTEKDINSILEKYNSINSSEKIIITTEKDAMRIQDCKFAEELKDLPLYFIPIEVEFLDKSNEEYFNKILLNYVRTNKRHSKLHK
jgi:tetraacyldisaccharide 4'-kinase